MSFQDLENNVNELVRAWGNNRAERVARKSLDNSDFAALADAGLTLTGVPVDRNGLWHGVANSARPIAMLLRKLASVDPSLALVATMHPTVLLLWLNEPTNGGPKTWHEQRDMVFAQVKAGHWFGTVASEPGIGGDLMSSKATAKIDGEGKWRMSGDKFMGSGSGMTSYMMTVAVPEGEARPDIYLLETQGLPWDGSQGLKLVRPWDGMGMAATQSHAFRFDNVLVARHGLNGTALDMLPQLGPVISFMFSAVFVGILDAASAEAKRVLAKRARNLSAMEQASWVKAENQIWVAQQAFEAMAQTLETKEAGISALHGKLAIADLAEDSLRSLSHAVGGASLSNSSPFGQWMQDVRALGYLRPPRALTYTRILDSLAQ